MAAFRPMPRPAGLPPPVRPTTLPEGKSLTRSLRPQSRPRTIELAALLPAPVVAKPSEIQAPTATSRKAVARSATRTNVINLRNINLIGITGTNRLRNALVRIAHGPGAAPVEIGPGLDLAARLGEGRLAMALVEAVPAGIYGKAALERLGLWEDVAPRVAQADNVRAALALVATGAAPYGIVYATDARAEDDVTAIGTFPAEAHPPILYPAAAIAGAEGPAAAFLDYLAGPEARAAFEAEGFAVVAD